MTTTLILAILLAAHYRRRYIREAARNTDLRTRTDTLIQDRYRVTRRDRKTAAKLWRLRLVNKSLARQVDICAEINAANERLAWRREAGAVGNSN